MLLQRESSKSSNRGAKNSWAHSEQRRWPVYPRLGYAREREKYKQDKNLAQILLKNQLLEYFWIEENYLCGSIKWTGLMGTFFEAIIGALYLDQGNLDSTRCFVNNYKIPHIDRILDEGSCIGITDT